MDFKRIEDAINGCKMHLDSSGVRGTEIESYLSAYLIVLIVAEYEVLLEKIIVKRMTRINDPHVVSFSRKAIDMLLRSPRFTEVTGMLGHFGGQYQQAFRDSTKSIPDAVAYYGNILVNRHAFCHEAKVNMTFTELETWFSESKKIFQALADSVGLTSEELADL